MRPHSSLAQAVLLSLTVSWCIAGRAHAGEFCIVRDGRPMATVVVADEPTHSAAFAAAELQYHVQKITGAALPVVSDREEVDGSSILVGESTATRKLGLRGSDFGEQEYAIQFHPDTLVLMGRDEPKPVESRTSVVGDVTRTEGRFGRALSFNGKDTAITVRDCGLNDNEGTVEACVWLPPMPQPR